MAPAGERILIVDDEPVVTSATRRILRRLGYQAVSCTNGREALDYYQAHSQKVQLVILDLLMPIMGGAECFRALKRLDPEVKVVLSSGLAFDAEVEELLDEGMLAFLSKPFQADELAEAVQKALVSRP